MKGCGLAMCSVASFEVAWKWSVQRAQGMCDSLLNSAPLLRQINLQVQATFITDRLRGDDTTEIHVKLIKVMEEEQPVNDE